MQSPDWYKPPQTAPNAEIRYAASASAEYAGFGIRAGARIIDTIVGVVLAFIAGAIVGIGALAVSGVHAASHKESFFPTMLVSSLGKLAYHAVTESTGGATVGKAILGLRVRSESLGPCRFGAAVGRSLLFYVDAFFFGLVAHNAMSKSLTQQRVGDRAAGTVVVYARSLPPETTGSVAGGIVMGTVLWMVCLVGSAILKML